MASGVLKRTTGLTGLPVARNPHHMLDVLYRKILNCLEKMPKDAAYRKHTEEIVTQRHAIVKSEKDVTELEAKINAGQAEELLIQAENELLLARRMLEWRAWEPLSSQPPNNQWKWPM